MEQAKIQHLDDGSLSQQSISKWQELRQKYNAYRPALFFIAGFLFDLFTLSQIDNALTLIQQGAFLAIISVLLWTEIRWTDETRPMDEWSPWQRKAWDYYPEIIHFLFGSLLSAYTIFFFLSASIWSSGAFIALIAAMLFINELPQFKKRGISVRFALYTLCLFAYSAYLVPILLGSIGTFVFLLSLLLTAGMVFAILKYGIKAENTHLLKRAGIPSALVLVVFTGFYFLKMIPPVPISIKHIGVYHSVELVEGKYQLSYLPSFWSMFTGQNSVFKAQPGDRIFVFTSVFSPARFEDSLSLVWQRLEDNGKWHNWDKIPLRITGGRSEGFRGFAFKQNYAPGSWRLLVQTSDGREVGRLHFEIEEVAENNLPRSFETKLL